MKMLTLCLTVILITTFASLLYSKSLPQLQLQGVDMMYTETINANLNGNIFYKDSDSKILLIDFKEVNNKLTKITVSQLGKLLMEDKVGDLAIDSIYELDMHTYGKGVFRITLITVGDTEITEEVTIN